MPTNGGERERAGSHVLSGVRANVRADCGGGACGLARAEQQQVRPDSPWCQETPCGAWLLGERKRVGGGWGGSAMLET